MYSNSALQSKAALTALRRLTLLNLVLVWVNAAGYLDFAKINGAMPGSFVWVTFFLHFLLVNALLFTFLWAAAKVFPRFITLAFAPFLFSFQHFFYALDQRIYSQWHFHVNGLVLQIVTQPDAGKVLAISNSEWAWAFTVGGLLLAFQYGSSFLFYRFAKPETHQGPERRTTVYVALAILALATVDKVTYAVYAYKGDRTILAQARVIPFYLPVSMNKMLGKILKENPYASGTVEEQAGSYLAYPKQKIVYAPDAVQPNIFWINIESWRGDSITPERMPRLWSYRERFTRMQQHFSGGNATRLGMFSAFYGLNPAYWDAFLAERRGPVFFDQLIQKNYQLDVLASASLNFLGTRDTVFRQIKNVRQDFYYRPEISDTMMLRRAIGSLDNREPGKPIFQFQFFDSTHSKYKFLPGFDPFKPYVKDINALEKGANQKRDQVMNRYWNAVYYTDFLVGRYLDALDARGLLDSSIIVITGDHGEEFWEHGHFTHASAFTDEQLRVPLWMHVPSRPATDVTHLTSHMDIVPTILEAMGVTNPASDYAQGNSIFGMPREFAVASGWGNYVVIDSDAKISFYATNFSFSLSDVTDRNDEHLTVANAEIFKKKGPRMMEVFAQFGEFLSKPTAP